MNLTTNAIDFERVEDQQQSLWLYACQQEFLALEHDTRERWESAARAWADVAKAWNQNALQDVAIFWRLASDDARKARGR